MKKILITGAGSYIGVSFAAYIKTNFSEKYTVDTVDMIDGTWREGDFSDYDAVFHVAGIAHRKETKENAELYYRINRDLAIETAEKAKAEGVKQFVFLSSMSVYGIQTGTIAKDTLPDPKSNYGKSKLQAEERLFALHDDRFKVAVLRPPMVYGKGCKGNYQTLRKFALTCKMFPSLVNRRSMIYIDNLCAYAEKVIDTESFGVFLPQDPQPICSKDLVRAIGENNGVKVWVTPLFNIVKILPVSSVKKVFGDLLYEEIDAWSKEGMVFSDTVAMTEQ